MIDFLKCCATVLMEILAFPGTAFSKAATAQWTANFLKTKDGQVSVNIPVSPALIPICQNLVKMIYNTAEGTEGWSRGQLPAALYLIVWFE